MGKEWPENIWKYVGGGDTKKKRIIIPRSGGWVGWGAEQCITVHLCITRRIKICLGGGGVKLIGICRERKMKSFQVHRPPHMLFNEIHVIVDLREFVHFSEIPVYKEACYAAYNKNCCNHRKCDVQRHVWKYVPVDGETCTCYMHLL